MKKRTGFQGSVQKRTGFQIPAQKRMGFQGSAKKTDLQESMTRLPGTSAEEDGLPRIGEEN
jgi:hypothetical protein